MSTPLIVWDPPRNPSCTACELHAAVRNVCLPMVPFQERARASREKALLVVGESPGAVEDLQGVPFVGPTGQLLRRLYLDPGAERPALWRIPELADVYLTNAVHCHPPANATRPKHVSACKSHLLADIAYLQAHYEEVVILCVGSIASQAVLGMTIRDAVRHQQAIAVPNEDLPPVVVFSTGHPGSLLPTRNPSGAAAVCEHLQLLVRYLKGVVEWDTWQVPPSQINPKKGPLKIEYPIRFLGFDIETYGALSTMPDQHYFHPRKMEAFDGVATPDLIQTIALGWRDPDGTLQSHIFMPGSTTDMKNLSDILLACQRNGTPIVGTNLKFDMMMMRHVYPLMKHTCLTRALRIIDVSVLAYLHNEQRTERSQKSLSALFGVSEYKVTLKDRKFSSATDPELHHYNAEDCLVAVCLSELFFDRIPEEYPTAQWKLSESCLKWYSDVAWMAIDISERGVCVDTAKLSATLAAEDAAANSIKDTYFETYGTPLAGPGSKPTVQAIIDDAVDSFPARPLGLELTKVTHQLSTGKRNIKTLLGKLPLDSEHRDKLTALTTFKRHQKLVSTYLKPMLVGRERPKRLDQSAREISSIVYPDWFITPSATSDDSDSEGGTLQCRMTCKNPALQTSPPIIKESYTTRFDPGFLVISDLSQIELRVAGLLSNDPYFMATYREENPDLHRATAEAIFTGQWGTSDPDEQKVLRQAGKKTNFLIIYRGGPDRLHESLMEEVGIDIPVGRCATLIHRAFSKYKRLDSWHAELLAEASKNGFLEIPLIGATRMFWGSRKTVSRTYTNTICNFPVQAVAAAILISAQDHINREFRARHMRSFVSLQVYDSVVAEGPRSELKLALTIIEKHLVASPYFQELCALLGRSIPLATESCVYIRNGKSFGKIERPT